MHRSPNYNKFFNPHVCHVCKMTQVQTKLTSCATCCMIVYCSEQHKRLHFEDHNPICKAIVKVSRERNMWNINNMTSNEWFAFRNENINCVARELQRRLEPYEEQMFWFVKSCFICHRQVRMMTTCEECFSVDSCVKHKFCYYAHDCSYLKLAFQQDMHDVKEDYLNERMSGMYITNIKASILDLGTYIEESVVALRSIAEWHPKDYVYSDYLSAPMTFYFAIHFAPFLQFTLNRSNFVIHILGASVKACALSAWEILSHFFSINRLIVIIFIGERLQNRVIEWKNCEGCCYMQKRIRFESYNTSYHNYMRSKKSIKPDVIMGYHLEPEQFMIQTIRAIKRQQCPLLLTAKSKKKADNNITKIQEGLNADIKPFLKVKNDFRGNRPYRDHEDDDVFFRNNYLITYENLNYP